MVWLLWTEVLIGMLAAALFRLQVFDSLWASVEAALVLRSEIHLVSSRPARDVRRFRDDVRRLPPRAERNAVDNRASEGKRAPPRPIPWLLRALAACVLFFMRQFAIRVLRAQWRPRQI
jgi:hypothetical protein